MSFASELKRRNVIRVAGLYLVGAWLIVQVAGTLLPMFEAPPWVARTIVMLVALGFVPALVLAWMFERTPDGVKRDAEAEPDARFVRDRARRMDRVIIVVLALGLGYFALDKFVLSKRGMEAPQTSSIASAPASKSIAVLPFADLSPGHDQEYFSDGMAEEILNALAKVKDLKVAARTASFHYKGRNESLKVMGVELGVDHVLEGSVRKQGEKVRITAQLVRTGDGFHLWSEAYDGELSDVFQLQERIARAITDQLQVILQGEQQQRLVPVATTSSEAYALFLKATADYSRRLPDLGPAAAALEEALRLDPKFARAQARLAAVHVVWTDRDAPSTELAESNARRAIALDDKLAEPWAVLGRSYGEQRRFLEAREAYGEALKREPDDALSNYWFAVALITTGYTKEGRARLDRALVLDPMQPNAELWRGLELSYAGDQEAAERSVQRAADMGLSFAVYGQSEVARARGNYARALELIQARVERRLKECGASQDEARLVTRASFGGDPSVRDAALPVIDRCFAKGQDPTPFWPIKALIYLDRPERALAAARVRLTNNETFLFEMLWSPYGKSMRRLPAFPDFARHAGLVAVWDQYGPPDWCRKGDAGDYACD